MNAHLHTTRSRQQGVAAVEFALVATILFALLFCIIEFGRLFFTINSMQEITRRAAREQVVNWVSAKPAVQHVAVLRTTGGGGSGTVNFPNAPDSGTMNFPGSPDITNAHVQLHFYKTYADAYADTSRVTGISSPRDNFNNCLNDDAACIRFVRATLTNSDGTLLDFNVIAPYMPRGTFSLPYSTVIMPAEAMGLL